MRSGRGGGMLIGKGQDYRRRALRARRAPAGWIATCHPCGRTSRRGTPDALRKGMGETPSVREVDALVRDVVLQSGGRREEADDLHLLRARVVQHVHGALRKEDD